MPATPLGSSPVEILEALLVALRSAHLACVPVLELDSVEPQHELVGLDKPLPSLLGAFKGLESSPPQTSVGDASRRSDSSRGRDWTTQGGEAL